MSAALIEHFELLAASLGGVAKLRELILSLAVRGKLVHQDPNDEPASELLKKIRAEKDRLIAEGRIKRDKPLPTISDDEKPYELPEGWEWVRLGSALEMVNGRAFKPSDWIAEGVPIVRIQNLNSAAAAFNYCDPASLDVRHRIDDRDFLISWSGTPGTSFGAFIWKRGPAALNQHIFKCIQKGSAFANEFLRLAINGRLDELIAKAHGGVGLQHVTKGKLEALVLGLPPLAEQSRIVAKVEELMALCDRLETEQGHAARVRGHWVESALAQLAESTDADEFARHWQHLAEHFDTLFTTPESVTQLDATLLQLAVRGKLVHQDPTDEPASELLKKIRAEKDRLIAEGKIKRDKALPPISDDEKPYELPEGWEWVRFGEYSYEVCTGPFGSMIHKEDYVSGGVPLINPSHMISGRIQPDFDVSLPLDKASDFSAYQLSEGDIVLARRGEVGRYAVVTDAEEGWLCGTGSFFAKFSSTLGRAFLGLLFQSKSVRDYLQGESVGTTMVNLNQKILLEMPIGIPPLAEQSRIVAKVEELMALTASLKARLAAAQTKQAHLAEALIADALAC